MTAGKVPPRHADVGPQSPVNGHDRLPGWAEGECIQEGVRCRVIDLPGRWLKRTDGREQKQEIQLTSVKCLLQSQSAVDLRRQHASRTLASFGLQRAIIDQ